MTLVNTISCSKYSFELGYSLKKILRKALDEIYKIHTILHRWNPIMKSASGKRPPDEAHGPGEETSRPQQCSEAWGK